MFSSIIQVVVAQSPYIHLNLACWANSGYFCLLPWTVFHSFHGNSDSYCLNSEILWKLIQVYIRIHVFLCKPIWAFRLLHYSDCMNHCFHGNYEKWSMATGNNDRNWLKSKIGVNIGWLSHSHLNNWTNHMINTTILM